MMSQKTLYTKRNLVDQKVAKDCDYRHHFLMSWAWKPSECEVGYAIYFPMSIFYL